MKETSDKKKQLASYKVRKSGNSDIATIPLNVQHALDIQAGDSIRYVIKNNRVELIKDIPDVNIEATIAETIEQYEDLLTRLVDL